MRSALLAGSAAATLLLAASHVEGVALETVARSAQRWAERTHRMPWVVPGEVDHGSLSLAGSTAVERHEARATTLETIPIPGGPVVAIAEREGELVLGAFDGGAWRVAAGRREPVSMGIDERINDLAFSADGTRWAATAGGAFRVPRAGTPVRLASGAFQAVAIWKNTAWFASPRGLSNVDGRGFLTRGREQGFAADSPGALADCGPRLCIGALDGLWQWDGSTATRLGADTGSLPSDWVTAIAFGSNTLWAGTFDAGLAQLHPTHRRLALSDGLPEARVQPHALVVGAKATWAGTPQGILELRDDSAALASEGLPSREVTALALAHAGGLWMGYADGAARIRIEEVSP
ncbi:MAG: hypothetical protein HY901_09395 [Deltaproteobacteria bacterium]|nr:hypothetical protein [Deltaproteobacteria bacterium]